MPERIYKRRIKPENALKRNQPSAPKAPPTERPGQVQISRRLDGRMEKRHPIMVAVRLSRAWQASPAEEEKTYTDNLSAEGARVFSKHSWRAGERVQVTSVKEASSILGEVIYCERLASDRFFIGLKFLERPAKWSILS